MEKSKCNRCKGEEYIPTHQFVKFDDKINYLCERCWDNFKRWFYNYDKEDSSIDNAA